MSGLFWLALDGVGHPADAPPGSPWEQELPVLRPLIDQGMALDAALGVPGLPQSGTGQSCWLTGHDAVALMGEHFGPQPGPTLQRLLQQFSLPVRLTRAGARTALVNRYEPQYLAPPLPGTRGSGRNRLGCFPYSFRAAGLPLNPPGLPLLGATLGLGLERPWMTAPLPDLTQQGKVLGQAAQDWDLLVADLWFSDLLGHEGAPNVTPHSVVGQAARAYLRNLDALLTGLLDTGTRIILSSDHGNFEHLGVKTHTAARVPFAGAAVAYLPGGDVVAGGQAIALCCGLS